MIRKAKQGHYLPFGVDQEVPHVGRTAGEIAAAVPAAGGIGFAAHPVLDQDACSSRHSRIGLPHGRPALDCADGLEALEPDDQRR